MQILSNVVRYIISLPPAVFIGIVMGVLCLVFGGGIKNALRSACLFSVGMTGINLIMSYCVGEMQSIATALSTRLGIELSMIDGGYGAGGSGGSWMFPGAIPALCIMLVINIVFILLKWTDTMWTDVHNTWHGIYIGLLIYALTGSVLYGTIVAIITLVIMLKLGDLTAPTFQEFNGTPNIAVYATSATIPAIFTFFVMKVINKIPRLKDLKADAESIQDRFGIFGEIMVIGMLLGIILGILAGYNFKNIMMTGVVMSATMTLFPKMAALICEGIVPVTTSVIGFMNKHFSGRKLNVAVDPAMLLGDPSVMASFVILVPISIVMAMVTPGIAFIPIASLAGMPYWIGGVVPYTKGNVVHTVICMSLYIFLASLVATQLGPIVTEAARLTGRMTEAIASGITIVSWDEGGSFIGYAFVKLFKLLGLSVL
jgi:PTS system galactitol-specific IIC component